MTHTQTVTVLTILLLWKQTVIDSLTLFFTNSRLHKPLAQWSGVFNQNQAQLSVPLTEVGMQGFSFFFSSRFGVMVTTEAKNHQFGNEHAAELTKQLFIYLGITCNPQHVKANQLECSMNLCFQSKTMWIKHEEQRFFTLLRSQQIKENWHSLQVINQRVFNASQPSPSSLAQR